MSKLPINRMIRLVCGLFLCALMFACGDNSTPVTSTGVQATYSSLWDNLFTGCGVNCHTSTAVDGTELGPDMSTKANFYAQVVGKSMTNYSSWTKTSNCNMVSFITPGNANESSLAAALILSVSDTLAAAHSCVTAYSSHDVISQTISDNQLKDALITWINNGAQNN